MQIRSLFSPLFYCEIIERADNLFPKRCLCGARKDRTPATPHNLSPARSTGMLAGHVSVSVPLFPCGLGKGGPDGEHTRWLGLAPRGHLSFSD